MQILVTAGLLLGLGAFLLVHGMENADIAARFAADHDALETALRGRYQTVISVIGWLPLAPVVIGLFWGAPVVAKEIERGTHKLVWTQSVPRNRWLAVKLGGLAAVVMLAGLAFGGIVSAWLSSFAGTHYADRFGDAGMFVMSGIVPAAWWLFAFAVGVAAGAMFRRTLPAIAATLAIVLALIIGFFVLEVRANYAPTERAVVTSSADDTVTTSDAQIWEVRYLDAAGREMSTDEALGACRAASPGIPCKLGMDGPRAYYFHPASRYWQFQWTEVGILLACAIAMGGVTVLRVRRRVV